MRQLKWFFLCLAAVPMLAWAGIPDIELRDLDGNPRNVNAFIGKGKWVAVMVWAHNCPICNREAPELTFFHHDHRKKDAIILGISIDGAKNVDKARDFVDRHSINWPNLITEPDGAALMKFGAGPLLGTPTFYLFDPSGELVGRQIGPLSAEELERVIGERSGPVTN